ncbi:hypothetical protein [Methyloglobulus sp.]|uniref:hypothetical protein n=1 Tax=Methyloglobulus sp. TaxID=2518622 RepID=UPI0032B71663
MSIMPGRFALWAFWSWILLNVVLWIVSLVDGSLLESMGQAVDYASTSGAETGMNRQTSAWSFVAISAVYFVGTTAVGGLLVHKCVAGIRWSRIVIVPLALWWAYESVSSPFKLSEMYPGTVGWFDWVIGTLGGIVWLFILACIFKTNRLD